MAKRKYNWYLEHEVSIGTVEDMEDTSGLFAVFEDMYDKDGKIKTYDTLHGIYDDLEAAKEYSEMEGYKVTKYNDYIAGNYDGL